MDPPEPLHPQPQEKRSFPCVHCRKAIHIPYSLPPTTAPCPHCGEEVTSTKAPENIELKEAVATPTGRKPKVLKASEEPSGEMDPAVVPESRTSDEALKGRQSGLKRLPLIAATVAVLIFIPAILVAVFYPNRLEPIDAPSGMTPAERTAALARKARAYREKGWQNEAAGVLGRFQNSETIAERALLTIGGEGNIPKMEAFYLDRPFNPEATPLAGFTPVSLSEADTARGIFLMNYSRPEQYDIRKFFRPIAPLRVEYGLESSDFALQAEGLTTKFVAEPVRVMAYFRKRSEGPLLLDWATYTQTKYRLFREFVENAEAGVGQVLRVFVQRDSAADGGTVFRLSDPAFAEDFIKVFVKEGSPLEQALNSHLGDVPPGHRQEAKAATVELEWSSGSNPQLRMKNFLCWEFLNLGGELDNWR